MSTIKRGDTVFVGPWTVLGDDGEGYWVLDGGDGRTLGVPALVAQASAIVPAGIDAAWIVGHGADGRYFLAERWPDGGGSVAWHETLLGCVADMQRRIEATP